jgi:hypothetical protein
VLTYFRSIITDRSSREYRLAQQQLSLKRDGSHSWFLYVEDVAHRYKLPNPHEVMAQPPSKESWKHTVKKAIHQHWNDSIEADAATKSSLMHMHHEMRPGRVADIWETSCDGLVPTARAQTKARLLTGTYRLQYVVGRQNKMAPDKTCRLCQDGVEDREHFLLSCPVLETERGRYVREIEELLQKLRPAEDDHGRDRLLQGILDCRKICSTRQAPDSVQAKLVSSVERLSRDMIHALHRVRWVKLVKMSNS